MAVGRAKSFDGSGSNSPCLSRSASSSRSAGRKMSCAIAAISRWMLATTSGDGSASESSSVRVAAGNHVARADRVCPSRQRTTIQGSVQRLNVIRWMSSRAVQWRWLRSCAFLSLNDQSEIVIEYQRHTANLLSSVVQNQGYVIAQQRPLPEPGSSWPASTGSSCTTVGLLTRMARRKQIELRVAIASSRR